MIKGLISRHFVKIKFVIVGVWNTLFGYAIFFALDTVFEKIISSRYVAYMSALVLANMAAIVNAYIFHKYITFQSAVRGRGILREFLKFSTTYLVTMCLSLILLPLFVEIFHVHPRVGALFILGICTMVSYFGHSIFSFRKDKADL
jgi:putative flippase GtrA